MYSKAAKKVLVSKKKKNTVFRRHRGNNMVFYKYCTDWIPELPS
jgi:hypothetical protein